MESYSIIEFVSKSSTIRRKEAFGILDAGPPKTLHTFNNVWNSHHLNLISYICKCSSIYGEKNYSTRLKNNTFFQYEKDIRGPFKGRIEINFSFASKENNINALARVIKKKK